MPVETGIQEKEIHKQFCELIVLKINNDQLR